MIGRDLKGCYGSTRLAIVVPTASCTVELRPRGSSMIRGSLWIVPALWKTHSTRFPQGPWTHRARPQRSTGVLIVFDQEKTKAVR
jgi:hypothetical protein